jgi:hypothetical protein
MHHGAQQRRTPRAQRRASRQTRGSNAIATPQFSSLSPTPDTLSIIYRRPHYCHYCFHYFIIFFRCRYCHAIITPLAFLSIISILFHFLSPS